MHRTPFLFWALCGFTGCAGVPVEDWGRECQSEMNPSKRLDLVKRIVESHDERAIPVLIDCWAAAKRLAKKPDRVHDARTIEPNETASCELWGLWLITRQDFDDDIDRWRAWYEERRGKLVWEGGARRFVPRD
jgi:hypothetical protein